MLSNTLVTNEIKDRAGVEVEFERISMNGQKTIYRKVGEPAGLPHRMSVSHEHTGTGPSAVRRTVVRFDKTSENTAGDKVPSYVYIVSGFPEGLADDYNDMKDLLANIMSFVATTGAASTVLFDGSGTGAQAILNESL